MEPLRVLLVDGQRETADRVERTLRRDLPASLDIVRASRWPRRTESFDAAIVLAGKGRALPAKILDLPTVVVGPAACTQDCVDLVRHGVQLGLSEECATCSRQSSLASGLMWAIEEGRLVRALDRARRREQRTALHDRLTGLPNAELCRETLRRLLAQARRKSKHVAVLYLDLDRFKEVNDHLGHAAGDRLLRDVAGNLRACARETDTVARRGGDEFVILLDDVRHLRDAGRVAQQMLDCISRSSLVQGTIVRSSASIGVAVFPEDGRDGETLERMADLAMYAGKRAGGNRVVFANDLPKRTSPDGLRAPRRSVRGGSRRF